MKSDKPSKVIIDTNLWISFLIGKKLSGLEALLVDNRLQLILSERLLEELSRVIQRPKLRKYFTTQNAASLLELLSIVGTTVTNESIVDACRDPKDNYLLALAKDSEADYIVTGDQDLLVLEKFGETAIVTYSEFIKQVGDIAE